MMAARKDDEKQAAATAVASKAVRNGFRASQTPGGNTSLQRPLGKKTEAEDIVCLCRPPGGALTDGLEAATHPCHHLGPPRG
ncbi:hypothetical protein ACOMHN_053902 [Nucella lapillus]